MALRQFFLSVSKLAAGTIVSQLIGIATAGLLGRLFAISTIGSYSVVVAAASIVSLASTGRYEVSIYTARGDRTALALFWMCVALACLTLAPIFLLALIACAVSSSLSIAAFGPEWPLGVVLALAISLNQILLAHANRYGQFSVMARGRVVMAASNLIAIVAVVPFSRSAQTLLLANILSWVCANAYLYRALRPAWIPPSSMGLQRYRALIVAFRRFPLYSLPTDLLSRLRANTPLFLLGIFYGATTSGAFAMVQTILSGPVDIISTSVLSVFVTDLLKARISGQIHAIYRRTERLLVAGGVIFGVIGIVAAPWIFVLFLGERWAMAGLYATLLMPMFACRFFSSPLSYVLIFYQRQRLNLIIQFFWVVVAAATFVVAAHAFSDTVAVLTYSGVNACAYVAFALISRYLVEQNEPRRSPMT